MAIRVVVVEDNDVFRNALEVLLTLGGEIEVVASEADGESDRRALRGARARTCSSSTTGCPGSTASR